MPRSFTMLTALAASLMFSVTPFGPPAHGQSDVGDAEPRLVTAVPTAAAADGAELFLLNGVQDVVEGTIELLSSTGEILRGVPFEVPPSDHSTVAIGELHQGAPVASIRVFHRGGDDALQAWLVLRRAGQVADLVLQSPGAASGRTLSGFWDLTGRARGARPVFYVLNTSAVPVRLEVDSSEPGRRAAHTVPAHGVEAVRPSGSGSTGWLEIRHDGPEGALVATGIVTGPGELSVTPLAAPREAGEAEYVTIRVPVREPEEAARPVTYVSLFNGGASDAPVAIEVADALTGDSLHRVEQVLAPRQIASLTLTELLGRAAAPTGDEVRLHVRGEQGDVRVGGFTRLASGAVLDLAFVDASGAHGSGHYPLVSLEESDVFLTVVNLGTEAAEVVAQLFWDGGWTYSYGPVTIPSGASRRIDVRRLADEATPDMMGRTLDGRYGRGMLKWKVFEGEPALVGRVEVRPRGTGDTFGFNCWGCCWEEPSGRIVPSNVSFFLHQSPLFEAGVLWSTCSGTMGPYPTNPDSMLVPAPFAWDASNVAASAAAEETLSFEDFKQKVTATCKYFLKKITGFGGASTCKHLLRKPNNPSQTWNASQTCTSQVGGSSNPCTLCQTCCDQILSWKICSKVALTTANNEHQACLVNCATDVCD